MADGKESIEIKDLLKGSLESLSREINNIIHFSKMGKLNTNSSRDLVSYIKLLHEMKKEDDQLINDLTDQELHDFLKKNNL